MKRVEKSLSLDVGKWFSLRPHLIPCLVAVAMLVGAYWRWPYDYYRLLRWVTFCVSLFVAYRAYVSKLDWAVWLFCSVALLFNPLVPIHLKRDTWQIIDGIAAVVFLAAALFIAPDESSRQKRHFKPKPNVPAKKPVATVSKRRSRQVDAQPKSNYVVLSRDSQFWLDRLLPGRYCRSTYFFWLLPFAAFHVVIRMFSTELGHWTFETLLHLAVITATSPIIVKRFHDMNMSGAYGLLILLLGIASGVLQGLILVSDRSAFYFFFIVQIAVHIVAGFFGVMCLFVKGTQGSNRYGPEQLSS